MDIRVYFQKIREIERNIQDPYVVVVSLETPEGGKPGRATEVSREVCRAVDRRGERSASPSNRRATSFYEEAKEALDRRRRRENGG